MRTLLFIFISLNFYHSNLHKSFHMLDLTLIFPNGFSSIYIEWRSMVRLVPYAVKQELTRLLQINYDYHFLLSSTRRGT